MNVTLSTPVLFGTGFLTLLTLSLLLAVLVVRPSGLFASGEAARLKDF